ncbi:putative ATP-dependent RNA helicase DDX52 [Scleropages formosus]|uniref:ATP-dependent RNA helicase n=1 Tax=Scleropages formosus TaxID=113540 RepID=A0A8C9UZX9_SCLFO|nr:probable ATP-dependent RNA helicase DDX52 [Scleropages formosus]
MDAFELFRKLGAGAKFDLKRFRSDAERFKVVRPQKKEEPGPDDILAGIDFFGGGEHDNVSISNKQYQQDDGGEAEEDSRPVGGQPQRAEKRKQDSEAASQKMSKKKKNNKKQTQDLSVVSVSHQGSVEVEGIQWTSSVSGAAKGPSGANKDKNKFSQKRLKHLHQEKVNRIRHQNRINVHGIDIPDPVDTFEELQEEYQLNPRIIQNLRAAGFQTPTPIQMQAIPLMLHRREILACAPTGSGKTVAFCLPLLAHLHQPTNKGFRALIISPTRELASQTHRELCKLSQGIGFRVHIIDKGAVAAKKYGPKSARKFDILVTTPNRLIYLLKQDPPAMDLSSVEWLVVDESDKLFEEGKTGFRDQLATIFLACTSPHIRRALFSATFALDVEQWCHLNLDNLVSISIGHRNSAADTVEQELLFVGTENGKLLAMRDLIKKGFMPPVLVFVQSIERARELFHELVYEGINVDVIHADRTQQQRDNVVSSFRSGKIWVLICTALLARGIDFKGINLVINYDFPTSAVEYIHRIGRTGRAGHKGKAITFFTEDDKPLLRSIANVIKQAGCPVPDYMIGFKKIHSKLRRKLEKKPPRRTTIRTTPRFLMKKGGSKQSRRQRKKKEGDSTELAVTKNSAS